MLEELLSFDTLAPSQNHTGEHRLMEVRGELAQIVNSGCFRHLVYLELKAGNFFRGKHYHQRREEVFYVISGRVKAVFEDIETRERLEKVMNAGDKVLILPKCAHVFFPIEYSQLEGIMSLNIRHKPLPERHVFYRKPINFFLSLKLVC